jgi:predicted O-methyltransferase YrrM
VSLRWIESFSDEALPSLLSERQEFDLCFVDGMHLFDYTLVDMYFAVRLVRVGGVIVLDDIKHPGVRPVMSYIDTNWPHVRRIPSTLCSASTATYLVVAKDTRAWDFHRPFDGSGRRS